MGINTIREMIAGATLSSLLTGGFSIFSFAVIYYYSVQLGLLATLMAAIIIGVTLVGGYFQLRYQRRETELLGRVSSLVLQMLTGIAKLRAAGAEMRAFAVWAEQYSVQKSNAIKAQSAANAVAVFNSASGVLTYMVIFASVAYFMGGSISTGEFVAFNTAFAQFLLASTGITTAVVTILQAAPFYERAKPILRTLPETDTTSPDPGELRGRVEVHHVYFRYDPDGPPCSTTFPCGPSPASSSRSSALPARASLRCSGSYSVSRSPSLAPSSSTITTSPGSTSRPCATRWGWSSRTAD
jgi:ABC-type bacteriocin/lantibiotic exporter with double-glycine peptidase domain